MMPVGNSLESVSLSIQRRKIGFVLLSRVSDPIPSTRIAVLNMQEHLRAAGFDPHVVFEPERNTETPNLEGLAAKVKALGIDLVYFQKVRGPGVLTAVREMRGLGIKTVYGVCDLVESDMAEAADATITVTDYLRSLYPARLQHKIHVVHDGIERPALEKTSWAAHRGSVRNPLNAVLVTSVALDRLPVLGRPPNWLRVTVVGRFPDRADRLQRMREAWWQMAGKRGWQERLEFARFLCMPNVRRVAWDAEGVYAEMQKADIGIIPIATETADRALAGWQVKSENRLTLKMSMGLPVVATPIPAYEPVVRQGINGFLARSHKEWLECLSALRDPQVRRAVGQRARADALAGFSMDLQAKRLGRVLHDVLETDEPDGSGKLPVKQL